MGTVTYINKPDIDLTERTDAVKLTRIIHALNRYGVILDRMGYTRQATDLFCVAADLDADLQFQIDNINDEIDEIPIDLSVLFEPKPEV